MPAALKFMPKRKKPPQSLDLAGGPALPVDDPAAAGALSALDNDGSAPLPARAPIRPKLVVFDFDGTLADCLDLSLEILNQLAPEFGYRAVDPAEMPELRNHGPRYIMKALGISKLKVPFLMDRCRKEYRRRLGEVQPFTGLGEALKQLRERGYTLGIVTSNAEENVQLFLETHGLQYFEFIHGKSSIWGKKRDLAKLLRKRKLAPTDIVYVGDETRDIDAAQANGIPIIAVAWGFNSIVALRRKKPDFIVTRLEDLNSVFA